MTTRSCFRSSIASPTRAWAARLRQTGTGVLTLWLAVFCLPGIAHAVGTATPAELSLAFNPTAVGLQSTQQLTASFAVTGANNPTAKVHYGIDYSLGQIDCTPTASGQTCTVPVSFAPTLPGARKDAVFLMDGSTILATVYLGGVGQSPFALLQPGVVTPLVSGATYDQRESAVDENGTVYILVPNNPVGSNVFSVTKARLVSVVPVNVSAPTGIAIDGAGILYIPSAAPGSKLITWNTVTQIQGLLSALLPLPYPCAATSSTPEQLSGAAVDAFGDVFTLDEVCQSIIEIRPDGTTVVNAISPMMNADPGFIAVDSSGNVFVSCIDTINEQLASGTQSAITNPGDPETTQLQADPADALYVIQHPGVGVMELPPSNYQSSQGALDPAANVSGIGLGSDGTLYVSNFGTASGQGNGNLDKVDRSQGAIAFGQQAVGTASAAQDFAIYNGGNETLTISSVAVTGSSYGYALQPAGPDNCSNGLVLAPGAYCQVAVTLTPTHVGNLTGSIVFSTNSLNNANSVETVALSGFVPGSYATLSPSPVAFPEQAPKTTSAATPVTLTNTGTVSLTGIVVSLAGASAADFSLTTGANNCGSSLPVGASCSLYITFTPQAAANFAVTLSVADGATNSPQTAALTGSGISAPAILQIDEVIHTTDTLALGISVALNIAEIIHTTDVEALVTGTGTPQPAASFSAVALNFSATAGTTSPAQPVTLTNTGKAPLTITSILAGSTIITAQFNETSNCGAALAVGASCTISVTFAPATTGSFTGSLAVTDNAPGSPQIVSLTGTGTAAPQPVASFTPSSLNFTATADTTSAAQPVTLTNTGKAPLNITNILAGSENVAAQFNETSNCGASLAIGASCTISVTFAPATTGSFAGSLSVTDNAPGSPQIVNLTGTGTAAPQPAVSFSAASLNFSATAGTTSVAQPVTLTNTGKAPLNITSILAGSTIITAQFNETSKCGTSLAIGASCTIAVTFAPATTGSFTGSLSVTDNAPGSPQIVSLTGTGTAAPQPVASFTPSSLNFSATAGTTSAAQPVTLTNTGKAPLSITSILAGSTIITAQFNETSNCGTSLAIGASCTIAVTFTPATTGSFSGNLSVTDNAPGSPQIVSLTGTGTAAPQPVATFTPSSLNFSATAGTTSAAQPVTLTNTGKAPLNITSILAGTTNLAVQFNETSSCGASLAIGASCTITVTFTPATTGSFTGSLSVTDNAPGSPQIVSLKGTGTAAPQPVASFTPSSLNFFATARTTSAAQPVTLTNTGKAPLTISTILADTTNVAAQFNETSNCGASLAIAASCTISVTFAPATTGTFTGSLSLTDNAPGSPQIVSLTGTGTAAPQPAVSFSAVALNFTATAGTASAAQPVTLTNTGKAPLTITSILAGSENVAAQFNETSNCAASLAIGASCTISVTFAPATTGSFTGSLSVTDNAPGSPQIVSLSGTGTAAPQPAASFSVVALNFTATADTTSAAQPVTLTNTGKAPLTISSILAGSANVAAQFNETSNCGASLAIGASCTIAVTFAPATTGSFTGSLSLTDNAPDSPQVVNLTGTGTTTPDFAIESSTPPQSVLPGGSAQFSLTVTAENGAKIPAVTLAASGLPPGATAVFSQSTVTPGSTSATSILTINTSTGTASKVGSGWPLAAPALALAGFFFIPARRRRRWASIGLLILVSLGTFPALSGCGGSSLPPAKSYKVVVTATIGTVQRICTVQLTVQ